MPERTAQRARPGDTPDPAPAAAEPAARPPSQAPPPTPAAVYAVSAVSALGGLLFGYDTGIISGALLHLRDDLHLTSRGQEIVVSVILLGAMAGALVSGRLAARYGRRAVVIGVAVVFAAGAAAAAVAAGVGTLIAARFVLGLAVGGASGMVPVYIAELAPAHVRGRLMVLFQLMVAIGQLVAYLCGWALADSGGWRTMFALAVIPAVALGVGMLFLPESPRWLVGNGRSGDARAVLTRLRPAGHDVERELAEIADAAGGGASGSLRDLRQRWVRPALLVAVGIAAFSQLTGINAIVYYAPTILVDAGFGDSAALLTGIGIGVMLVIAGVTGAVAVDRVGRRRTMLWFLPGSAVAMAVLALAFVGPVDSPAQRWTVIVALFAYILCNGIGMQAVVWLIGPEILPLGVRGPATGLATVTLWGFDLLIALSALTAIKAVGQSGTFLFYALMNVTCIAFVAAKVPETRGRSLESIERALRRGGSFRKALDET
ncbi:sugar porter family MFS transporter [Streptomyces sp. NPDC060194]|uniref:sugar porter family MFS transporter n=1 Tax=Streptomyces sp. NPDC060194 TaxID=3347069 RepID=UPI003668A9C0